MKNTKNTLAKQDKLILRPNPQRPYVRIVILRLSGKERIIGTLDLAGEGTFSSSRKPSHLFKKTNSLGVPFALLTNDKIKFKWIVLDFMGRKYVTSRSYFLAKGHVRQYQNFELQILLPLDLFGIQKARNFEKFGLVPEQQNLFSEVCDG